MAILMFRHRLGTDLVRPTPHMTTSWNGMAAVATLTGGVGTGKSKPLNSSQCHSNLGYSSYVWLVPEYTMSAKAACTGFEALIQQTSHSNKDNIALNVDGPYRYIVPVKEQR